MTSKRHSGHTEFTFNHFSMHIGWKVCALHGKMTTVQSVGKVSKQIEQVNSSSSRLDEDIEELRPVSSNSWIIRLSSKLLLFSDSLPLNR